MSCRVANFEDGYNAMAMIGRRCVCGVGGGQRYAQVEISKPSDWIVSRLYFSYRQRLFRTELKQELQDSV